MRKKRGGGGGERSPDPPTDKGGKGLTGWYYLVDKLPLPLREGILSSELAQNGKANVVS